MLQCTLKCNQSYSQQLSYHSSLVPIFFKNPANRENRHSQWQQIVKDEEAWWEEKTNPKPKAVEMVPWDSSKSVVMGLASGYPFNVYERKYFAHALSQRGPSMQDIYPLTPANCETEFVGSLRATGYSGHIILGVSKDLQEEVVKYFKEQNVSIKHDK